jgi:magnesium transporter
VRERDFDIDQLFVPGNEALLDSYLHLLHHTDIAQLFSFVPPGQWRRITQRLGADALAEVFADLDEAQRELLGRELGTARLVAIVDELETDDAADVLANLPVDKTAAVLPQLEFRDDITKLLGYPEDSAGGIMQMELCRIEAGLTVADAIHSVRQARESMAEIFDVYVVERGRLLGTVALADLVLSKNDRPIKEIRQPVVAQIPVTLDQEEVVRLFRKFDVAALPVVDGDGLLVGRITFDDVHDVIEEEASEDILAMAGASGDELVYRGPVVRIAVYRLPWLLSSLLGSLLTTTQLVPMFARTAVDSLVLAAFIPVMMAMTGNVGSQSAMIVTRGLAVGKVRLSKLGRTLSREFLVGSIMGATAGLVVALFSYWMHGNPNLGYTLALAMTASMTVATLVGVAAPSLFRLVGIDPAIAAGPLVTTCCDVLGVSIYLLVALLML